MWHHTSRTKHDYNAGFENAFYEGPLRLRLPVQMSMDTDGAFSFDVPLPTPSGKLGKVQVSRHASYAHPYCLT